MNGSFALPIKYSKLLYLENIWFSFAFFAFLILPWFALILLDPKTLNFYYITPSDTLFILFVGGVLFGVGQVCFSLALGMIGFSLGFVINIGLGTGLGFLLPLVVLHPDKIISSFGWSTLLGTLLILIGLIFSYKAGQQREKEKLAQTQSKPLKGYFKLGVFLSIIAGLSSASQNFTFAMTQNMQELAVSSGINSLAVSTIIWPIFLLCSFFPYGGYMLYLHRKNNSFHFYTQAQSLRYISFALIMGSLWYCSLVLYSEASLLVGKLGPVVVWPLFMVLIILTSNLWGWVHKEWEQCQKATKTKALVAIMALVVAVIILAYSATLS